MSVTAARNNQFWYQFAIILILCILASGCSANYKSIYRAKALSKDSQITLIDAKQRSIISSLIDDPTASNAKRKHLVICAEASPDVFSVYANALAAGVKVDKSGDPSSLGVGANLSFSSAETGSTIPRTQTLTMLREMMYRTCERYLDGAISKLELPIQAARDQRVMIAALAIEGLTGAVRPPTVITRASGSANSGSSSSGAAEQLAGAREDVKKAEADEAKKQKTLDDLNAADPKCTAKEIDDVANAAKKKSCGTATVELAAAKKTTGAAQEHYANIVKVAESSSIPTSASTSTDGKVEAGSAGPGDAALMAVADTVGNIVTQNYQQPEFLFFCLKFFGGGNDLPKSRDEIDFQKELYSTCVDYIKAGINAEAVNYAQIVTERAALSAAKQSQFDKFWMAVVSQSDPLQPDTTKLAAIVKQAIDGRETPWAQQAELISLGKASSKADASSYFGQLSDALRIKLFEIATLRP